ncbi:MAG: hypothetical protein ACOX61_07065 [Brooklawnia sp.]|jgi:galactokinase
MNQVDRHRVNLVGTDDGWRLSMMLGDQAGHALLLDDRDQLVQQLPFEPAGLSVLLITTHLPQSAWDSRDAERRASCEQAAELLGVPTLADVRFDQVDQVLTELDDPVVRRRAEHVIRETERSRRAAAALAAGDWKSLGAQMIGSHASLRYLYEVSCPELDAAVDLAVQNRALGARMTTAGPDAAVVMLVLAGQGPVIASMIEQHYLAQGWPAPQVVAITAG